MNYNPPPTRMKDQGTIIIIRSDRQLAIFVITILTPRYRQSDLSSPNLWAPHPGSNQVQSSNRPVKLKLTLLKLRR